MKVENFVNIIGTDFYTGVPDSQLKALCDYLMYTYGICGQHHIIAANEGNATAIAAGYHLATGKIPVVYMQNSGEGNIINPLASLMNEKVYAIPCIFIIGWRGEPGVHDEPQHIYQGKVTCKLLEDMGIDYFIVEKDTADVDMKEAMNRFQDKIAEGHDVAFIIRKGALTYEKMVEYKNGYDLTREKIIRHIVSSVGNDLIVCTTGKASRELFEIREENSQGHERDFLTVGSMGHTSSLALGIAINKAEKRVWCIDGDGAVLMHMGAMAVIGSLKPKNLVHVVINNGAHETVGGMPTVGGDIDFCGIAESCGYPLTYNISSLGELDKVLNEVKEKDELCFIEAKCGIGARANLGRPTTTPIKNKLQFTKNLRFTIKGK